MALWLLAVLALWLLAVLAFLVYTTVSVTVRADKNVFYLGLTEM